LLARRLCTMINYLEVLALLLLLCAAPLAWLNWLLGGYTHSLPALWKLLRQGRPPHIAPLVTR
jgi:hypothetical protein